MIVSSGCAAAKDAGQPDDSHLVTNRSYSSLLDLEVVRTKIRIATIDGDDRLPASDASDTSEGLELKVARANPPKLRLPKP